MAHAAPKRNVPKTHHNTIIYEMVNYNQVHDNSRNLANNMIISSINWYNSQYLDNQNLAHLLITPHEEKNKT
jgi:hypothetical protein